MTLILGERLYEKTGQGKYPKYTLEQMNRWVDTDCMPYVGINVAINVYCYDLFHCYQDALNVEQKKILDNEVKRHYGFVNVDVDDLVDWGSFEEYEDVISEDCRIKRWRLKPTPSSSVKEEHD